MGPYSCPADAAAVVVVGLEKPFVPSLPSLSFHHNRRGERETNTFKSARASYLSHDLRMLPHHGPSNYKRLPLSVVPGGNNNSNMCVGMHKQASSTLFFSPLKESLSLREEMSHTHTRRDIDHVLAWLRK